MGISLGIVNVISGTNKNIIGNIMYNGRHVHGKMIGRIMRISTPMMSLVGIVTL